MKRHLEAETTHLYNRDMTGYTHESFFVTRVYLSVYDYQLILDTLRDNAKEIYCFAGYSYFFNDGSVAGNPNQKFVSEIWIGHHLVIQTGNLSHLAKKELKQLKTQYKKQTINRRTKCQTTVSI